LVVFTPKATKFVALVRRQAILPAAIIAFGRLDPVADRFRREFKFAGQFVGRASCRTNSTI
jgi:hypothetical protein